MTNVTNNFSEIYSLMEEYFKILKEYGNIGNITQKELDEFYETTGLNILNEKITENNSLKKMTGGVKGDWKKEYVDKKPDLYYYKNIKTGETRFDSPESSDEWEEIKTKTNFTYYQNKKTGKIEVNKPDKKKSKSKKSSSSRSSSSSSSSRSSSSSSDSISSSSSKKKTSEVKEEIDEIKEEIDDVTEEEVSETEEDVMLKEKKGELYHNEFLKLKEQLEEKQFETQKENELYPHINDTNFNIKISRNPEFSKYIYEEQPSKNIEEISNKLCNRPFQLKPHQHFVRNFLSLQTPYNNLLLFHGLGSGKTCSAIGITEEMREYIKHINQNQRIIIVASPNVQTNFRIQLFDEKKLKKENEEWNIEGCVGNNFLKDLEGIDLKNLSKESLSKKINNIINQYYIFMGYVEFANYIKKTAAITYETKNKDKYIKHQLKKKFSNRLIVIDEIHNIRISKENLDFGKKVAKQLQLLINNVDNLRLLMLSGTPMYNNHYEIIWLLNLMNSNDNRSLITISDIFDKDGNFLIDENGNEIGKQMLQRKARGYVSFIKGADPYTFPYRIFPYQFNKNNSLKFLKRYPLKQFNGNNIIEPLKYVDVFINEMGSYQKTIYDFIIDEIKIKYADEEFLVSEEVPLREDYVDDNEEMVLESVSAVDGTTGGSTTKKSKKTKFSEKQKFGYQVLQKPIEALNIVYPYEKFEKYTEKSVKKIDISQFLGKNGLKRCLKDVITYNPPRRNNFEYKTSTLTKYGRIFSPTELPKYSSKMANICKSIMNSKGIVLIYSQFIDGGIIPMALSLEELGFVRYKDLSKRLFKDLPTETIDSITLKPESEVTGEFKPASYAIISGDKLISPNNEEELKAITDDNNINGENIKVLLISQAGSEGLDFKNIRQVHILDPWYNMNRIEQTIGRAVRNCSHKRLPFIERNVEIYLHATIYKDYEPVDLYLYRLAEQKAIKIGLVTRALKECAIDCLLTREQLKEEEDIIDTEVEQSLSSGITISYKIGDKPFSAICDYMDSCNYQCRPEPKNDLLLKSEMTNEYFLKKSTNDIHKIVKDLFKENFFYEKEELYSRIKILKEYLDSEIHYALTELIEDKYNFIYDKYNRIGRLINLENLYFYQPLEIDTTNISLFERETPISYKHDKITTTVSKKTEKTQENTIEFLLEYLEFNYENAFKTNSFIIKGDEIKKSWYLYFSKVIKKIGDENISKELLKKYLIEHMVDMMEFKDYILLLNYLYNEQFDQLSPLLKTIKTYIEQNVIYKGKSIGTIINKNLEAVIYIFNGKEWVVGEYTDKKTFGDLIINNIIPLENIHHPTVGFISYFRNKYMAFKTKKISNIHKTGSMCDNKLANEIINELNLLENKYTSQTLKKFTRPELCVLQEIKLRHFDHLHNSKERRIRYFLNPVECLFISKMNTKKDKIEYLNIEQIKL